MTLADFTTPELLLPELRSVYTEAVIAELCSTLHREQRVRDLLPFYNAVLSREMLASTATASGWAMPHARVAGLDRISFAFGRAREPLKWLGNGANVSLVFLLAAPEGDASYLQLISGLARLSKDRSRVQRLLEAADAASIFELFQEVAVGRARTPVGRT